MRRRFTSILMCFALIFLFCLHDVEDVFAAYKSVTVRALLHDTGQYATITPSSGVYCEVNGSNFYKSSSDTVSVFDFGATSISAVFYVDFHINIWGGNIITANGKTYYAIYKGFYSSFRGSDEYDHYYMVRDYYSGPGSGMPSYIDITYFPATTITGTVKNWSGGANSNISQTVFHNAMTSMDDSQRTLPAYQNSGLVNRNMYAINPTGVSGGVFSQLLPTSITSRALSYGVMGSYNGVYEYLDTIVSPAYSNPTVSVQCVPHYAKYTITAKDSQSNSGIPGIVYSTTSPVTGAKVTATTNVDGVATFSLPWKTGGTSSYYDFKEESLPSGYSKSGSVIRKYQTIANPPEQDDSGKRTEMNVTHTATYTYNELLVYLEDMSSGSDITVSAKDSSTAEPINSATFTVKNSSGTVISTLVTNAIGEATVTGIEKGTYTVTQTGTGADYNFTSSSQSITVDASGAYVYFTNARKTGSITFNIKDSAGNGISGAKFILSGNGTNTQYTTNSSGVISLAGIRYGPYVLTEYDIPVDYVPKSLYVEFTLNNSTNGTSYTYNYNKVTAPTTYGDITINLCDSSTGVGIKGGTFQIKNSVNTVVSTVVTNAIGTATVRNLPVGTYTVTQTAAATYYINGATTNTVTVTPYGASTNFTNARQTGTLSVYIKDTTGANNISGAQFILSGGGVVNTQTSTDAGLLTFSGVRLGEEYHLTEYVIPDDYVPRNLSVAITMTDSAAAYTYNYSEVSLERGNLIINLYDASTGAGIMGGAFQVKNSVGTVVTTVTTNSIGTVSIYSLAVGTYTVTQTAPGSYYANNAVTNNVNLTVNGASPNFTNDRLTGTIDVYVKDITGTKNIADSQFFLTGNGTNTLQTANSSGLLTFAGVRQGEPYRLIEYYIPGGYISKNMTVDLTLNSLSATYTYNYAVSDDWRPPSISFDTLPSDNSVTQHYQTLTLTDNRSGVKELRINGVSMFVQPTQEALSVTYIQEIYANGTYKYELIDYAGNIYTTTQNVKCISNYPLYIDSMAISNYKSKVDYGGELAYVVNSSYPYSNVNFSVRDEDPDDGWTYEIELMTLDFVVLYTVSGSLNKVGNHTARVQYRNEITGSALDDGIYIVSLTVNDEKMSVSKYCKVIVKNSYPPKPTITYSDATKTVSIQYPVDLFEGYSSKEYYYLNGLTTYTNSFAATESGVVTAVYTDIAGNKTSTAIHVSVPRQLENGETGTPLPSPVDNDSSITGIVIEENNNFIVYYIGIRSARGKGTEAINELLAIIR